MNSAFPHNINNSQATCEPFISYSAYNISFTGSLSGQGEMQSSSVTPGGFLWLRALSVLAGIAPETSFPILQSETEKKGAYQHLALSQKNQELIQLLRSWREGDEQDEQEQQSTLEYLKSALDENRPSERKLFP